MIATDEDALICDLAETYNLYDYKGLPLHTVATLSCGLRDNSRIKKKLSNTKQDLNTQLLAIIADKLSWLVWSQTEEAQEGSNRPKSLYMSIMGLGEAEDKQDLVSYDSADAFEEARQRIIKGE